MLKLTKILAAALMLALSFSEIGLYAQGAEPSKAEKKQYAKLKAKPSIKACEKYLQTYASSSLYPKVLRMKDSLVFHTRHNVSDAVSVAAFIEANPKSPYLPVADSILDRLNISETSYERACELADSLLSLKPGPHVLIFPYRNRNVERICVMELQAEDVDFSNIRATELAESSGKWEIVSRELQAKYQMDVKLNSSELASDPQIVKLDGSRYLTFAYLNSNYPSASMEMVYNLYSLDNGTLTTNAIFYGINPFAKKGKNMELRIEGRSPESMAQGGLSRQQAYLLEAISNDARLVNISEADALSDDAIESWYRRNPAAMGAASSLTFIILPENSSLVEEYRRSRKVNSKLYSAAVMDFRANTVIVSFNRKAKNYCLVWAEPECLDPNKDRYLSDIYFENNGSTLDLFYYKGKKTFKYYINLSSKTLRK